MRNRVKEVIELVKVIRERKLSIPQVTECISTNKHLQSKLAKKFILNVDYSKTLQQMLTDGNYDWTDSDISEKNFHLITEINDDKRSVSAKLFCFGRNISSQEVISKIKKAGYRPATITELLVLGKNYPKIQKKFSVVALGSVWHNAGGFRYVPVLGFSNRGRGVVLSWYDGRWSDHFYFLAINK